jgi:hypothetical protein
MTATRKIIIEIQGDLTDQEAMSYAYDVVMKGRVSEGRHGKHFCWVTVFHRDRSVEVLTRQKQYKSGTDSLIVRKVQPGLIISKEI